MKASEITKKLSSIKGYNAIVEENRDLRKLQSEMKGVINREVILKNTLELVLLVEADLSVKN